MELTNWLDRFLSNRWLVLTLAVSTMISVPLGVFFYLQSQKERALTFHVYPLATTVLRSGYAEGLRVFHKDEEVKANVSTVQIAIWNEGKEPIFKEHVLEQIEIVTRPGVQILEATVRQQTRKIVNVSVDNIAQHEGIVRVSWRLLEHRDGAIIQLIYVGTPESVTVELRGVILGQKSISAARAGRSGQPRWMLWLAMVFPLMGIALYTSLWREFPPRTWGVTIYLGMHMLMFIVIFAVLCIQLFWTSVTPPFAS